MVIVWLNGKCIVYLFDVFFGWSTLEKKSQDYLYLMSILHVIACELCLSLNVLRCFKYIVTTGLMSVMPQAGWLCYPVVGLWQCFQI